MTGCECSDVITVEVKVIYCPQRVVMCRPGWKAKPGPAQPVLAQPSPACNWACTGLGLGP